MQPIYKIEIPVRLDKKDMANVRRILDGRFDPLPDARLIVSVTIRSETMTTQVERKKP